MVPLFTPPRIVSSKFFFLVLVVHREVLKKRGKRKPKSVFEFNQLKIIVQKKYIFSSLFTPKHLSIRSNLSNTNNTKLLHHVVFSLVFAKGKNFSLFSLASRERRELDF